MAGRATTSNGRANKAAPATTPLRQVREAAGLTQLRVAAETDSALPTVRLYEANPSAVSPAKRRALDPYYEQLRQRSAARRGPG